MPKSAEVMAAINIALMAVEASGTSRGMGMAEQVNGLEMLVAKGEVQRLA